MPPLNRTLLHPIGSAARAEATLSALFAFAPFAAHHPWITRIEPLGPSPAGGESFRVYESMRLLGFIPQRPIYDATVRRAVDGVIVWEARIRDKIDLSFRWRATAGGDLEELITIDPGRLVARYFMGLVTHIHSETIARLVASEGQVELGRVT